MDIEKWKDEIMDSIGNIQRAGPPASLYEKIRLQTGPLRVVERPYALAAAACLILLIALNIWAVRLNKPAAPADNTVYQFDPTHFELYQEP